MAQQVNIYRNIKYITEVFYSNVLMFVIVILHLPKVSHSTVNSLICSITAYLKQIIKGCQQ